MIDGLLKVGTLFDWLSPTLAWIQDLHNGPNHTFFVPEGAGWSGLEVQQVIKKSGVKTWGLMAIDGQILLTVPRGQAAWAAHILQRAGVPLSAGEVAMSASKVTGKAAPAAARPRSRPRRLPMGSSRLWQLLER